MTMFFRRLIISCLGLLGGLAAWPLLQILLQYQTSFPSFLLFSLVSGAVFGLIFGAFFSTSEGIILKRLDRFFAGMAIGALIGAIGGAAGFLVAQRVFLFFGERLALSEGELQTFGYPVSRALGWAVLGTCIGITEGIRVQSRRKFITGIVGGFLGGLVGGFILEALRTIFPLAASATLIGLILLGISIGLAYSFIERRMSYGIFRILNGPHKGKEFILNQDKMSIGSSYRCHVLLADYDGVESRHGQLQTVDRELLLKPVGEDQEILVNDIAVSERLLKFEDVIKIGTVKLLYKHE
ncbi:FHA domain-containing protein [Spirochaeta dissipatitropha]